jgi:FdhD protein
MQASMPRAEPFAGGIHTGYVRRAVRRWHAGVIERADDTIAEEVPIAFVYNDEPHVVMMATPCDLEDLALGFSLSEALIGAAGELERVDVHALIEGIELRLRVPSARAEALRRRRRNLVGRTGCGLCGAQVLEDALRQPPRVGAGPNIEARILALALAQLHERQPLNVATGATHAAAWFDCAGTLALLREDVGRHNALDKLIGALVRADTDVDRGLLVVTSRASYEMVQKAATAGIALLAAISAPTALAIQLAEQADLTLVGFARGDSHVVYAHPRRIVTAEPCA